MAVVVTAGWKALAHLLKAEQPTPVVVAVAAQD
jgi:hypothetical protein